MGTLRALGRGDDVFGVEHQRTPAFMAQICPDDRASLFHLLLHFKSEFSVELNGCADIRNIEKRHEIRWAGHGISFDRGRDNLRLN